MIILNVITEIHSNINTSTIASVDAEMLWGYFYISLLSITFGILIEWERVLTILRGNLKVNWLIIPSMILLVVSLTPLSYTFTLVGISSYRHFPYGALFSPL